MRCVVFLILLSAFPCFGQNYFRDHFGGTIGLSIGVGSHVNSFGVTINGYYTDHFYQFNLGTRFWFFERNLGNRKNSWENRSTIGLVLLAGEEERIIDFEVDGLNHQTNKNLGVGYNFVIYSDGTNSSHRAGGFGIHIHEFALYHENDIFGFEGRDRYRTGQFHFSYQHDRFKFTTGVQLWTGETRQAPLIENSCEDCNSGYRDLRDTPYGRTSHGILYAGLRMDHAFGQNSAFRIGWDGERVRHIFQNKLIHDIGKFIRRPTPHYPMLDANGLPTFDKTKARPTRPYLSISANSGWAY